jgi:hypothetical protein
VKRLYRVRVEYDLVVYADDEDSAEVAAVKACQDGGIDAGPDFVSSETVATLDAIPVGWAHAVPYGLKRGEKERTVAELMASGAAE